MLVYRLELNKLLSSAAVWGFLAVCLLLNLLIIRNAHDEYASYVGAASEQTGIELDASFHERLSQMTAGGDRTAGHLARLKAETDGVTDVFDGYETAEIGERYIAATGATGYFARAMRDKYAALQNVVDEKAERDESLSLYFAGATHHRHQFLFQTLLGWLLAEGALAAVLLALLAAGYEHMNRTGDIVYATRTGRQVLRPKLAASVTAGLGAYALLAIITLLAYFGMHEHGDVWRSNVSSLFNYRVDLIAGTRPFVTWYSFTVLTYLLATLGAGAGVALCFLLLAFGIGIWVKNSYIAFLVFLAANAVCIAVPVHMPPAWPIGPGVKYGSVLSPVWLWLKHGQWFTDGDVDIVWAHFETIGLCASLLVAGAFCLHAVIRFRKRNLT